ncbi:MAG: hypothetical protein LBI82_10425 [Dysgonamonadaceae bacterium]|jgi:hypothetical protein|nr:hypothetical protein [Dysgonamonadaceae bacterium]
MKKVILTLSLFGALFFTANTVSAKGVIIYSNGEKIEVIQKLDEDVTINDEHVNLGVMYDQFSIFWIPIWNYGGTKYVLINDKRDTYYDLDDEDFETLKTEFNVGIPDIPTIGFWNRAGGKIVWAVVLFAAIFYGVINRKDTETDTETESEKTE